MHRILIVEDNPVDQRLFEQALSDPTREIEICNDGREALAAFERRAADLILLRDDLGAVTDAISLARATFRTIRRNLAWAFGYNVAAIPLAALGFLNPILASATMTLSSVFVVASSLRLQRYRVRYTLAAAPR